MIKVVLSNEILNRITNIEKNKFVVTSKALPVISANKLQKLSKKKRSYSSNKIEGNPLSEEQADSVIEKDPHNHFLRPEQEIRNYFLAINYLEECKKKGIKFSKDLVLNTQAIVEKGASKEKIGFRGPMPPGYLFAVYDSGTGQPEYIPPYYSDLPTLIDELVEYVNTTDDHPLIIAAIVHYQLVTIHAFEDGNGRTARLLSGYILDFLGYDFGGVGSLEEYFAYDPQEYYKSLQMGLPALYYEGRNNPPHSEIWINYFLRMVELYSKKVCEIVQDSSAEEIVIPLSRLSSKEKVFLKYLLENNIYEFTPIELSKITNESNRTIINRCSALCKNGFLKPILVKERIRSYKLNSLPLDNKQYILHNFKEEPF